MNTSSILFATPTFFSGMARVVDLGGVYDVYNEFSTPEEADAQALARDWMMVGQDMNYALKEYQARVQKS